MAVVRRYGLAQEYIKPYSPEQNGMIERFFPTLKQANTQRLLSRLGRERRRLMEQGIGVINGVRITCQLSRRGSGRTPTGYEPVGPQNCVLREILDVFRAWAQAPRTMRKLVLALLSAARSSLKSRRELALENLALRQQLAVLRRHAKRPKLSRADRAFWGGAGAGVARVADGLGDRAACDGDPLAPQGLRPVLEVDESQVGRATPYGRRDSHPHPRDGPRQRRLGRAAHPR